MQPPKLAVEQAPRDEAEAANLANLTQLVTESDPLADVRDLALGVRALFPEPAYLVGCGSAHIWLHRAPGPDRLALIR